MITEPRPEGTLERLRVQIEQLDEALLDMIAQRVRLARQVGQLKRAAGLPTLDPAREASVVRRAAARAREAGLIPEDVRELYWHVIGLCRRAQADPS
jgi:chorismate mutase